MDRFEQLGSLFLGEFTAAPTSYGSRCGSGTESIMAQASPLSVRFGSSQCSQNNSGRFSGDLSCMCPVASVAGLIYPSIQRRSTRSPGKHDV